MSNEYNVPEGAANDDQECYLDALEIGPVELRGFPVDTEGIGELQKHFDTLRESILREYNLEEVTSDLEFEGESLEEPTNPGLQEDTLDDFPGYDSNN